MPANPLYHVLASRIQARANCEERRAADPRMAEWSDKHKDHADKLCKAFMPSGSGFDDGTQIDWERSKPEYLVFRTAFHHINDSGYVGWTHHRVTVRPSLVFGIVLHVSGRDWNEIKYYIYEVFQTALQSIVSE